MISLKIGKNLGGRFTMAVVKYRYFARYPLWSLEALWGLWFFERKNDSGKPYFRCSKKNLIFLCVDHRRA